MGDDRVLFRLNLIIALLSGIIVILLIQILSLELLVIGVVLFGIVFPLLFLVVRLLR